MSAKRKPRATGPTPPKAHPLDVLVERAIATHDPDHIADAVNLRREMRALEASGDVRVVTKRGSFKIVPITDRGRQALS